MDRLPQETFEAILEQCILSWRKNQVSRLRLVCRAFDRILKPHVCRTLNLDFLRLTGIGQGSLHVPSPDALQTIGYACTGLYIDMMVLRDEDEVSFLDKLFRDLPRMDPFVKSLKSKYCMSQHRYAESNYLDTVESLLFNCRGIKALSLSLPYHLFGRHSNIATRIFANTLKAFANRPEEDSAELQTLVVENVFDRLFFDLWNNPVDVKNIILVLRPLQNLVVSLRKHDLSPARRESFSIILWSLLNRAEDLRTLCLRSSEYAPAQPRGLKQTRATDKPIMEWRAEGLGPPRSTQANLTCLELRCITVGPEFFVRAVEQWGGSLKELYLNEVYLKAEQQDEGNFDSSKTLWIGLPNRYPSEDSCWIATKLRPYLPHLRICRASFLGYDHYIFEHTSVQYEPDFDLIDPCGLGRSVAQRFVEAVMGLSQPNTAAGDPVEYLADAASDIPVRPLQHRTHAPTVVEYDTNAYQIAVANTTSRWEKRLDGVFRNHNQATHDALRGIAETVTDGVEQMSRLQRTGASDGHRGLRTDRDEDDYITDAFAGDADFI